MDVDVLHFRGWLLVHWHGERTHYQAYSWHSKIVLSSEFLAHAPWCSFLEGGGKTFFCPMVDQTLKYIYLKNNILCAVATTLYKPDKTNSCEQINDLFNSKTQGDTCIKDLTSKLLFNVIIHLMKKYVMYSIRPAVEIN